MKSFCKDLKEHGAKIIGYEKVVMIPLIEVANHVASKKLVEYAKIL